MTKTFSVNIGGQPMQFDGPDDGTQEDAQKYAEAAYAKKQQEDIKRDFSGETAGAPGTWANTIGRKVANFAQGGAELVGGPAQLAGATPGPNYQTAENAPHDFGDSLARFAGATLPLAPLAGGMGLAKGGQAIEGADPGVAQFLASKGLPVPGKIVTRQAFPKTAAAIPVGVGAAEGASAPADSRTQRAINTGIGAATGGISSLGASSLSALDRLAGAATGFGLTGGHGWSEAIGAAIGERIGGHIHPVTVIRSWLEKLPPSVRARMMADIAAPVGRAVGRQYDEFTGDITGGDNRQ